MAPRSKGPAGTTTRLPAPVDPKPSTATTGWSWHAWSSTPTRTSSACPCGPSLYVRRLDVPELPRGVTPWAFRTKLELAAAMIHATAESLKGQWDGPVWLLTDGGYAKRPVYAATKEAGWVMVTRLRRDAHLNDLPPVLKPGQKRGRGRPRIYGSGRIKLALRVGQNRGWEPIEVVMSRGQLKRWEVKTFLATWRVAGGVVRVRDRPRGIGSVELAGLRCQEPGASVQEIAQGVADRWGIEQVFHDVKENERIGQVQLRKVWGERGCDEPGSVGQQPGGVVGMGAWEGRVGGSEREPLGRRRAAGVARGSS